MSQHLPNDSELQLPDFTLVTASAGSGKTTALTKRFLQILLSERIPFNGLRNVLAVTFTNNAATEVKQRVLDTLKRASFGEKKALRDLREVLDEGEDTIARRAGELVGRILEHYSDFQVQTIDSFLVRVLRVSALEMGLPPDFVLALSNRKIYKEAFGILAHDLTKDRAKASILTGLIGLINDSRPGSGRFLWHPYEAITDEVCILADTLSARAGWSKIHGATPSLGSIREQIRQTVRDLHEMAKKSGFDLQVWFQELAEDVDRGDTDCLLKRKLTRSVLKKSTRPDFEQTAALLEKKMGDLERTVGEYADAHAATYYEPYIRTLELAEGALEKTVRRGGTVHLGDSLRRLALRISEDLVPEIYFALGERIHHFLIDEFQDTSPLQWKALRPLIEHALAGPGSLFLVGDTKQSIFTFRGADWRIMRSMDQREEFPSVPARKVILGVNYRSTEAVVEFTRRVFHEIVPSKTGEEIASLSGLASDTQIVQEKEKGKGYVELSIFGLPGEGESKPEAPERAKLLAVLGECQGRGYRLGDIAVLTPRNTNVVEVSRWLNEAGIPFLSHSSLDVRTRKVAGELLALLRFLDSPLDDLSFATVLLGDIFRARVGPEITPSELEACILRHRTEDNGEPLYQSFRAAYPSLWHQFFEDLFRLAGYLPPYDLLCEAFRRLSVFEVIGEEEAALVKLLEVARNVEGREATNLQEFLTFAGENSDDPAWNIGISPREDAVTVMTVHKAKGLGYQVLILLLYDARPRVNNQIVTDGEGGSVHLLRIVKDFREKSKLLDRIWTREEVFRTVDELNKLYVALTRARKEMYILSVRRAAAEIPSVYLPPEGMALGNRERIVPEILPLPRQAALLHPSGSVLEEVTEPAPQALAERRRGEYVHAVLERITGPVSEPTATVRAALQATSRSVPVPSGLDPENLVQPLTTLLENEALRPFFEARSGERVLHEQEIVSPEGHLYRIDKLLLGPGTARILDFKTGDEREEHRAQVRTYMELLRSYDPELVVRGLLAYVDLNIVREVL